jgi:hypothetical protein
MVLMSTSDGVAVDVACNGMLQSSASWCRTAAKDAKPTVRRLLYAVAAQSGEQAAAGRAPVLRIEKREFDRRGTVGVAAIALHLLNLQSGYSENHGENSIFSRREVYRGRLLAFVRYHEVPDVEFRARLSVAQFLPMKSPS